jgi:DNA-binding transcriptional LysR family regulator
LNLNQRSFKRPRLDLRQLDAFVAVAEELHFGRAAARIHIAQSPLSRIIQKLESELGTLLFVRNNRNVRLTPAGEALLDGARDLLDLADLVAARVASI